MKFLVIKELGKNGEVTPEWLAAMRSKLETNPVALREDYAALIKSIAHLQVIETTLRNEVLHEDTSSQPLKDVSLEWLPTFGTTLNDVSTKVLNAAGILFTSALNGALGKLVSKL